MIKGEREGGRERVEEGKTSAFEGLGRKKLDVILSDRHAGPRVLSARRPLITFKFRLAREKTRHAFDQKKGREGGKREIDKKGKHYSNTKLGGMTV